MTNGNGMRENDVVLKEFINTYYPDKAFCIYYVTDAERISKRNLVTADAGLPDGRRVTVRHYSPSVRYGVGSSISVWVSEPNKEN